MNRLIDGEEFLLTTSSSCTTAKMLLQLECS